MPENEKIFGEQFDELCENLYKLINLLREKNSKGDIYDIVPERMRVDIMESMDALNSFIESGNKLLRSPIYRIAIKGAKNKIKDFFNSVYEEDGDE